MVSLLLVLSIPFPTHPKCVQSGHFCILRFLVLFAPSIGSKAGRVFPLVHSVKISIIPQWLRASPHNPLSAPFSCKKDNSFRPAETLHAISDSGENYKKEITRWEKMGYDQCAIFLVPARLAEENFSFRFAKSWPYNKKTK